MLRSWFECLFSMTLLSGLVHPDTDPARRDPECNRLGGRVPLFGQARLPAGHRAVAFAASATYSLTAAQPAAAAPHSLRVREGGAVQLDPVLTVLDSALWN